MIDVAFLIQQLKIYQSATIVLLVISVLVIVITFFGCCGAAQESRCLLATVRKKPIKKSLWMHIFCSFLRTLVLCLWYTFVDWNGYWCLLRFYGQLGGLANALHWGIEKIWRYEQHSLGQNPCASLEFLSTGRTYHYFYVKNHQWMMCFPFCVSLSKEKVSSFLFAVSMLRREIIHRLG